VFPPLLASPPVLASPAEPSELAALVLAAPPVPLVAFEPLALVDPFESVVVAALDEASVVADPADPELLVVALPPVPLLEAATTPSVDEWSGSASEQPSAQALSKIKVAAICLITRASVSAHSSPRATACHGRHAKDASLFKGHVGKTIS
jgi:hypothetical protein